MMMTASTIAPMAMAMPPSDMMFELMPWPNMTRNEISTAIGQDDDGHQGAAQVHEEGEAHQRDDEAFLEQLFFERLDGAIDQRAAVVGDGVLSRPAAAPFIACVELLLHVENDLAGVGAVAHHDDAADGFALAVQLGDAAPHVGAEFHVGDLAEQNRHALVADAHGDFAQIVQASGRSRGRAG